MQGSGSRVGGSGLQTVRRPVPMQGLVYCVRVMVANRHSAQIQGSGLRVEGYNGQVPNTFCGDE
jgi:hypothetical protein